MINLIREKVPGGVSYLTRGLDFVIGKNNNSNNKNNNNKADYYEVETQLFEVVVKLNSNFNSTTTST